MSIQLVNISHPKVAKNTSLRFIYEAGDSQSNLHVALEQYQEDIVIIQGMKWRYVSLLQYSITNQRVDSEIVPFWGI